MKVLKLSFDDLDFISRKFSNWELPRDKKYLLKYFTSDCQQEFLRYYLIFGNFVNFCDHTGFVCGKEYLLELRDRLREVEAVHDKAKQDFDLEYLAEIENGKFKYRKIREWERYDANLKARKKMTPPKSDV